MRSILTERSRTFVTIVLTSFRWEASLKNKRMWDTELFTGLKNWRMVKKNWRGKCLGIEVKRSLKSLLYILVGRLVLLHLVHFRILVLLLNLLILIFLYLSEHATFNIISRIIGGGKKLLSHNRRMPGTRSGWSEVMWYSKKSWLLVIEIWSPYNQGLDYRLRRTQTQLG